MLYEEYIHLESAIISQKFSIYRLYIVGAPCGRSVLAHALSLSCVNMAEQTTGSGASSRPPVVCPAMLVRRQGAHLSGGQRAGARLSHKPCKDREEREVPRVLGGRRPPFQDVKGGRG
jgi:hypothetical protein